MRFLFPFFRLPIVSLILSVACIFKEVQPPTQSVYIGCGFIPKSEGKKIKSDPASAQGPTSSALSARLIPKGKRVPARPRLVRQGRLHIEPTEHSLCGSRGDFVDSATPAGQGNTVY